MSKIEQQGSHRNQGTFGLTEFKDQKPKPKKRRKQLGINVKYPQNKKKFPKLGKVPTQTQQKFNRKSKTRIVSGKGRKGKQEHFKLDYKSDNPDNKLQQIHVKMSTWKHPKKKAPESMAQFFKSQVHSDMNRIYSNDNDVKRHQKLKELERQKYYQGAIRKLQSEVVQLKKIYSKVKYQNDKLEDKQEWLKKEQGKIDGMKQKNQALQSIFDEKNDAIMDNQEIVKEMKNERRTLSHMLHKRKQTILAQKENIFNAKKNLSKMNDWIKKEKRKNFRMVKKQQVTTSQLKSLDTRANKLLRRHRKHELGDRFENLLNEEMSIFEGKVGIEKIKHLEQDRLDKIKQELFEQQQKEYQEQDYNRYMTEKMRDKELENRRIKLRPDLENIEKIRKQITKDINSLTHYIQSFKVKNQKMNHSYKKMEERIIDKQLRLKEVKAVKKQYMYDEKHNKIDSEAQTTIEQIEMEFRASKNQLSEHEKNYKKLNTTLNEIVNSVSRILYQLYSDTDQKGKNRNREVKKDNVVKYLSTCGLRLERMLTYIIKKKKSFRIESINTDGTFDQPPKYLGINPNIYTKMEDINENDEFYDDGQEQDAKDKQYFEEERKRGTDKAKLAEQRYKDLKLRAAQNNA